jgi:DUF4097 and DUF4098 domain-containing protein YvlB
MKTNSRLFALALVACLATAVALARDEGARSKSFTASKGGTVEVTTSVGDITISTWEKNEVSVSVEGLDDEDLDKVKMKQEGNTVRVSYRSRWNSWSGHVSFDINVPSQFNADINTSGGNLEIRGKLTGKVGGSTSGGDIRLATVIGGPVEVSTSGGNIRAERIDGDGTLKTSGGDINVGTVGGSLSASTSGGNIDINTVMKTLDARTSGGNITIGDVGGEARVSTSGGDVSVGKVSGKATLSTSGGDIELKGASGRVSARTSGGDVMLRNITGSIEAKTAGGEVEAELIPSGKGGSRLSSAGGDIRLSIAENSKVTIEATIRLQGWGFHRDRYVVKSDFPSESYETDEDAGEIRAVYKLNGGGELVELNTVNSNIEIRRLHR